MSKIARSLLATSGSIALLLGTATLDLAIAARGGPDGGGYYWSDSKEPQVDTSPPGFQSSTPFTAGFGDESVEQIDFPVAFVFPFYGNNYTSMWVSSNGWMSFTDPAGAAHPVTTPLPSATDPDNLAAFFWKDLEPRVGVSPTHGPTVDGGYKVFYQATDKTGGAISNLHIVIYPTGVIRFIYISLGDVSNATIGIEDAVGGFGTQVWRNGVGNNGAQPKRDYAITFYPDATLDCAAPTPIACNSTLSGETNAGAPSNAAAYSCMAGSYLAPERVYSFTLTEVSDINIDITGAVAPLEAFLLDTGCHELQDCLTGGAPPVAQSFAPPGDYFIAVDAAGAGDVSDFDLNLTCSSPTIPATCEAATAGTIGAGAPSRTGDSGWAFCPDQPGPTPGAEDIYEVTLAAGGNLVVDMLGAPPNLHVFIADPLTFQVANPTCIDSGPTHAAIYGVTPGETLLIIVDDVTGAGGNYTLEIDCAVKLDCSGVPFIDILDPTPTTGTTVGALNLVDNYLCTESTDPAEELLGYTGGEAVFRFTVPANSVAGFTFAASDPDMDLLILSDCDEGLCVSPLGCVEGVPPGDYYVVVDGLNGASGAYTLTPFTVPTAPGFMRWYECNECIGGPPECDANVQIPARQLTNWTFSSGTFCGWGCQFAMYVVVECGTEMHLPLFDVETAELQIFDILRNNYVDLTLDATPPLPNPPWSQAGTTLSWADSGCASVPCPPTGLSPTCGDAPCNGGMDPMTDQALMDIYFDGSPSACGVYRVEFLNAGGCVWDIFANCDGTAAAEYPIYRDVCSALTEFQPLPDLVIENVRIDNTNCVAGTAEVIVDVRNTGCQAAIDVPIEVTDGVAPQTFTIPLVAADTLETMSFTYPVTVSPTTLTVSVDPGSPGLVLECPEAAGSTSCGSVAGVRTVMSDACPDTCSTLAVTDPSSVVICEGSDLDVDGASSAFSCQALGPEEYQWSVGANIICPWSTTSTCTLPASEFLTGANLATLEVRCRNGACDSSAIMVVDVNADVPPPRIANSLRGIRSGVDAGWNWQAVIDPGLTGYRLYHAPSKDVNAADRTPAGPDTARATVTLSEPNGIPDPPNPVAYYQVVGLSCSGLSESPY